MTEESFEFIHADFAAVPASLDLAVVKQITDLMDKYPAEDATTQDSEKNHNYRSCERRFLDLISESWLSTTLQSYANVANQKWMLDIDHVEQMEILDYHRPNDGYKWHRDSELLSDTPRNRVRKLTIIVQLSDSHEYEGCDLQISNEGVEVDYDTDILDGVHSDLRQKGTIILFPSFQKHRITPLISGRRKCLVAWVGGPVWR